MGSENATSSEVERFLLSAEDIHHVRGRFEQLEYEITAETVTPTTTTLATADNDVTPYVWKDFRRVYAELDILQEELQRNPATAATQRVNPQDLVSLLERSHPQLLILWDDAVMSLITNTNGQDDNNEEEEDSATAVEHFSLREAASPRAIEREPLISSSLPWVDFVPSPPTSNRRQSPTTTTQQQRRWALNASYYSSNQNGGPPSNLLIADLSGHTSNETMSEVDSDREAQRRRILLLLDQCEATKFPFKKKLLLSRMGISSAEDIPTKYLLRTPLGNALHKLSLAGNPLHTIPSSLVQSLPSLRHLDLSECELHELPAAWHLPCLKKLNLSHNRLRDFPHEGVWTGLPELTHLNLYGNKIAAILVPTDSSLLTKLEVLNVGYNDLAYLPPDLDQLVSLRTLKAMNNFIEQVPRRVVCEMHHLKTIDVTFNPVIQPPLETCERGMASMRRYFYALQMEQEATHRASTRTTERFRGARVRRSI